MASHDHPVGGDLPRSLSEQLRLLEQQLHRLSDDGRLNNGGPARAVHTARQPFALPMSLGRPIGLAPERRAPRLAVPMRQARMNGAGPEDTPAETRALRGTLRRRAVICAISLLLLSSTAIIPSLWHLAAPDISTGEAPASPAARTEQFAHAARALSEAYFMALAPAENAAGPQPMPAATPADLPAPAASEPYGRHEAPRPVATLTVVENDLERLSLPMLVSGGGRTWTGSAVIIDGLPAEARVSHGMKIAPDTWTVGIADVAQAVLSLPRSTPDRLELSVRVLAANSQELAASALRIHVLRNADRPAESVPAALFEPAAAETDAVPDIDPDFAVQQAVKVNRPRRPARPSSPAQPPATQQAAHERPATTSAWMSAPHRSPPSLDFAPRVLPAKREPVFQ